MGFGVSFGAALPGHLWGATRVTSAMGTSERYCMTGLTMVSLAEMERGLFITFWLIGHLVLSEPDHHYIVSVSFRLEVRCFCHRTGTSITDGVLSGTVWGSSR